jgi:hypothetical protein
VQLWTEYEGDIIAGAYTLGKLQRSEGRNAFFLSEKDGKPALLRLTEALNDEPVLLTRWKRVAEIEHPNLLPIMGSGGAHLDGSPIAWALLERTDAALADVLRDRVLTADETKEVAIAVAGALSALHDADLIHQHVDASNVFAVGEVVKLRSDCVRECEGEFENDTPEAREALRRQDIHDLGLLLTRCLTPSAGSAVGNRFPSPFDRVVPGALDGTMKLSQILLALGVRPASSANDKVSSATVPAVGSSQFRPRSNAAAAPPSFSTSTVADIPLAVENLAPGAVLPETRLPSGSTPIAEVPIKPRATHSEFLSSANLRRLAGTFRNPATAPYWFGGAAAAILLGIIFWNTGSGRAVDAADAKRPTTVAGNNSAPAVVPVTPPQNSAKPSAAQGLMAAMQPGWHVIAYTYNYEGQARKKVDDLQKRYLSLNPQVFSPTGRAPYFVALGNGLDQSGATALLHQARRAGLPRDTYIRAF